MIWIFIAIVIFVTVIALSLIYKKRKSLISQCRYNKLDTLFSLAERSFLGVLNQAIEDNAVVFGKVRVADVITPIKGLNKKEWQQSFNKISSKHFDFILCDKNDLAVLCAIELNDKSHNSSHRKARDEFLQSACESANLPLMQISAQATYNIDELRQSLISNLSG